MCFSEVSEREKSMLRKVFYKIQKFTNFIQRNLKVLKFGSLTKLACGIFKVDTSVKSMKGINR